MDGSHHGWFEGRRGWAVLMVMIDDATGRVFAQFFENESWHSAATIFRAYVQQQGLPRALYVDQHGIYRADREANVQEVLAGKEPQTQFGRALAELGVEWDRHGKGSRFRQAGWYQLTECNSASASRSSSPELVSFER